MAGSVRVQGARRSDLVDMEMADGSGAVQSPTVTIRHSLLFDFGR